MATIATVTVTITDTSSMTAAEAAQLQNSIAEMVIAKTRTDTRVTSVTPTFASAATTLTIA